MKKSMIIALVCMSGFLVSGCGMGSVSCGDEPTENERGTEISQTENIASEREVDGTENINEPAEEGEGPEGLPTPEVDRSPSVAEDIWGVSLTAKDITPTGLTVVCSQSGGSPTGELSTGSYYILEKETLNIWSEVDYVQEMEVCWDAVAYTIPMDSTVEWEVTWEWLYGELPAGHYRIGKEVMDFRMAGDYDESMYYAEFEIEK